MKDFRFGIRSIPYLLLLIAGMAYGTLIGLNGFYWDDWPFAWIAKFLGPGEFFRAFAGVRPFLGPIFFATTSLLPPSPIYWQIFAVLIRFCTGWVVWSTLRQVWPRHQHQMLIASALFLVFPGYSQQWVAFTHINQEWIPFLFYLLSFRFTVHALRNPDHFKRDTAIALVLTLAGVFPTEYFVALEPIRLLFIGVIIFEQKGGLFSKLGQAMKNWAWYLAVWLGNIFWLAYFYTLGSYDSYAVTVVKEPFSMLATLGIFIDAFWKAGIYSWVQIVPSIAKTALLPSTILTVGLIALSFIFLVFYLTRIDLGDESTSRRFAFSAMLMGCISIVLGRIPSFAAGLPLTLQSSYDRFMISMMLGGCLFVVGLVEVALKSKKARHVLSALLIAMGIGQQYFNANTFRRDWEQQNNILWQIVWRVPGLQPGTVLLTDELPLDYETDLSFTAPLNWMYGSETGNTQLKYGMIYSKIRLDGSLPSLNPNTPIYISMRGAEFYGSTSQAVVLYMPESGCLRVLDARLGDQKTYAHLSKYLVEAIPLSNPDRILVDADRPMGIPFMPEPAHSWCYYYTKAELARQQKDWQQVIDLIDEANSRQLQPADSFEWLPYIEAQALMGHVEIAERYSTEALKSNGRIRRGLCQVWKRIQVQIPAESAEKSQVDGIVFQLTCE